MTSTVELELALACRNATVGVLSGVGLIFVPRVPVETRRFSRAA